jgi:hypothetical protein
MLARAYLAEPPGGAVGGPGTARTQEPSSVR